MMDDGSRPIKDPETPAERREAVCLADGLLVIDAARNYGLITGGPDVDVARCQDILEQARDRGHKPQENAIQITLASFTV